MPTDDLLRQLWMLSGPREGRVVTVGTRFLREAAKEIERLQVEIEDRQRRIGDLALQCDEWRVAAESTHAALERVEAVRADWCQDCPTDRHSTLCRELTAALRGEAG